MNALSCGYLRWFRRYFRLNSGRPLVWGLPLLQRLWGLVFVIVQGECALINSDHG